MKNITIAVDEDVARWARVYAAEQDTSVSRLLGEMLRERMDEEVAYEEAMRSYFARQPRVISSGPYPRREELYDRHVVR